MNYEEKRNFFEILCKIFGRFQFPIPTSLEKKYLEEITFCGLDVQPREVFSTSIIFPLLLFFLFSLFCFIFHIATLDLLFSILIFTFILSYFLLNYTSFFAKYLRAKASSEIILSIVYMAISLRISQNLEKAVEFAASNLSGPIGKELKRALINVKFGRSFSIKEELKKIGEKWKLESQEFNDALSILIKTTEATREELERNLEEAINIVIVGTKRRMKDYALKMKTSLNIVNAFGVLMPLLLMVFLPIGIIFLPNVFKQTTIFTLYLFVLPSIVYIFLLQHFYSRPYSYHQIMMNLTEEYRKRKKQLMIILPIIVLPLLFILFKYLISVEGMSSKFLISLAITNTIGLSIGLYFFLLQSKASAISEKISKYEDELPTLLYQISIGTKTGQPLESVFENIYTTIRSLEISNFIKEIVTLIRLKGISLREALVEEREGILSKYPSKVLSSCMRAMIDIAERGSYLVSDTLKSISTYLDTAKEVNKFTDEVLSEVISEMKVTSYVFAPLSGGIIVGIISILISVFIFVQPQIEKSIGGMGEIEGAEIIESLGWLLNLTKQIPLEYFQLAIGVYVIEIVLILSWFLGEICYGEDEVKKSREIGRMLFSSLIIYSLISIFIYGAIVVILSQTPVMKV